MLTITAETASLKINKCFRSVSFLIILFLELARYATKYLQANHCRLQFLCYCGL